MLVIDELRKAGSKTEREEIGSRDILLKMMLGR